MSKLSNKIEAHDRSITEVLDDKKYTVDYFQREFKWEERHIEQLVSDLTSSFLNEYKPEHKRKACKRASTSPTQKKNFIFFFNTLKNKKSQRTAYT